MSRTDWTDDALCAQTGGDWYADETPARNSPDVKHAKQVCALCCVATHCLEYALANDERFGIWGGLTAKQRQRIRTRLHLPPAPKPEDWHGTPAGARRHYRRDEQPCNDCLRANRLAKLNARTTPEGSTHG